MPSRYKYLEEHVPTNTAQTPPNPPAMKDFTDSAADPASLSSTAGASLLCVHECCQRVFPSCRCARRTIMLETAVGRDAAEMEEDEGGTTWGNA